MAPAARLVRIPDGIDEKTAAAAMLKGVTAYYLLFRTFKVKRGHDDPVSRRRRRHRVARLPVGGGAGGDGHRHGRLGRQDRGRARQRLRARHQLPPRGFRRAHARADRRRGRRRRLRLRRQGHVPRFARLPQAARDVGLVRPIVRHAAAVHRRPTSRSAVRCSRPVPPRHTTSPGAPTSSRRRKRPSPRSPRGRSRSRSARNSRCGRPPPPTARWSRARPSGRSCWCRRHADPTPAAELVLAGGARWSKFIPCMGAARHAPPG